jgi:hypothetical protein
VTTLSASFETTVAQFRVNIDTPLPTDLISFSAACNDDHTVVSWQTATEHNSALFVLERSINGQDWVEATTVESAGNSTTKIDYSYDDYAAIRFEGYYRLTQIDNDGAQKVYDPIHTSCEERDALVSVYPNPTEGDFSMELNASAKGNATFTLVNANNQVLKSGSIDVANGINQIFISGADLGHGMYYLHIDWNGQSLVKKVVVR